MQALNTTQVPFQTIKKHSFRGSVQTKAGSSEGLEDQYYTGTLELSVTQQGQRGHLWLGGGIGFQVHADGSININKGSVNDCSLKFKNRIPGIYDECVQLINDHVSSLNLDLKAGLECRTKDLTSNRGKKGYSQTRLAVPRSMDVRGYRLAYAKDVEVEGISNTGIFQEDDGYWKVFDYRSGLSMVSGKTQTEAIKNTNAIIARNGLDKVKELIASKDPIYPDQYEHEMDQIELEMNQSRYQTAI